MNLYRGDVVQPTTPPTVMPPNQPMTLFGAWSDPSHTAAQQAVARGEVVFNSKPLTISGVTGLNDALGMPSFQGSCTTCHNAPNVGDDSTAVPLNIGIADASRRTPDMPPYTLRNSTNSLLAWTSRGLPQDCLEPNMIVAFIFDAVYVLVAARVYGEMWRSRSHAASRA